MEIERKFLVASLPDNLDAFPHVEIEQGYLCTSPTLRIRRMGDVFWLTVKEKSVSGSTAIHNREEEFRLDEAKYMHLKTKCDGRMVRKTRYRIPIEASNSNAGLTAELDIFHGEHEGLILVEVEFPSTADADSFVPPSWFGADVSQNPAYRNSHMAFS